MRSLPILFLLLTASACTAARPEVERVPAVTGHVVDPLAALTPSARWMVESGRALGARSLSTGKWDSQLQEWAQEHADYQARIGRQTHDPLNRLNKFNAAMPGLYVQEVVAETWPENTEVYAAANDIWSSWKYTERYHGRGHWGVVDQDAVKWAYAMAQGRNGKWYGCGLVASAKGTQ